MNSNKSTNGTRSTWVELAALPLIAGFALGSSFLLGGDDSLRMIKSFAPQIASTSLSTSTSTNEGTNPGRHVAEFKAEATQPWGLLKTNAAEAWRIGQGSEKIVVAVIDTGADITHPDLEANIWTNPGETGLDKNGNDKASNGIDDDGNGFVDDVHGWNFVFDNQDVRDNHGHGTHIAGIIGGTGTARMSGVSPNVSLMILKYFDPRKPNQNPLTATVQAIKYAVANGANVINYSGGGLSPNSEELAALSEASKKGILVIAAAGNEHSNSDNAPYFPADYDLPNILSVTAIDPRSRVLPTSNYGAHSVDIAAPGEDIFSTMPGGTYGKMTGTSQATAFATGVAVLVMASHPNLKTPAQIIEHLISTGETTASLRGKTRTRSTLNAYRALAMHDETEVELPVTAADLVVMH